MWRNEQGETILQNLFRKGAGDEEALCTLIDALMIHECVPEAEIMAAAEILARLAAANDSIKGKENLAAILLARSYTLGATDTVRADRMWWEAMEILFFLAGYGDRIATACLLSNLEERANSGDDRAAALLYEACSALTPEGLTEARADVDAARVDAKLAEAVAVVVAAHTSAKTEREA